MTYMKKIIILVLSSLFAQSLMAGSIETGNPVRERTNKQAPSESFYKKIVVFQEMISDSRYVEARAGLEKIVIKRRLNKFEEAQVNRFLAWIDSGEGKYVEAAKKFQLALDSDSLSNHAHLSMMIQVAQLYMNAEDYQKGIDALHKYYKVTDSISDQIFMMEANGYSQLSQFKKAIPILIKAINLADEPKESWNYLLYSLHMEVSQFLEGSKVLETLIKINPNKEDYWKRLSEVYFHLKKDAKALAVLVLAVENGMLKDEKERIQLFKMYAFLEVPYKAGQVLEEGLKSGVIEPIFKYWDDLGKTWHSAAETEKALEAYDEASKLATDGTIDLRRAYIYYDREEWRKAKTAILSAIEKGGLKENKVGTAWLLLGMVESEMNNTAGSVSALRKAIKYKNTKKHASQWLNHLDNLAKQAKRRAAAEKALADAQAINGDGDI